MSRSRSRLSLLCLSPLAAAATLTCAGLPAAQAQPAPLPVGAGSLGSTVAAHEGVGTAAPAATTGASVPGLDASHWQGGIDWMSVRAAGARFAYVKATESTDYTDPDFGDNYRGAYSAGLVRGAYHFALPDRSSGVAQADWFVAHGGGWSADGRTLPPLLDIEYDPYGPTCYGLSPTAVVRWVRAFSDEVKARTGRYPAVYTTTDWWTTCTGGATGAGRTDPLFLARYSSSIGALPAGWTRWRMWQHADSGPFPGDQDVFNGTAAQLRSWAAGS